jgi:uncharacterized membrane protein (UPF0182 family)
MRVPSDLPRPRRERIGTRGRVVLAVLAVALFILITSLRGIAGFYTDLLWFDSLGFRGVFTGVLGAKIKLVGLFSLIFFVLLWLNLFVADRLAPRFRPMGPEEEVIERYHELIGHRTVLVRTVVSALFALVAGAGVSGRWRDWLLFTNAQDFNIKDRQFDTDVGFYVFRLPFLQFVVDWAFAAVVIVLLVTAVAHYLNGGIRLQTAGQRVTPQVKAHLSVLLALLALIKAAGYFLQRYQLQFSSRGTVDGATYTDVKAQLPATQLLILISLAAVLLLIVNIWRRGWVLPILAVGLWGFVAIIIGNVYPTLVQKFRVEPSESSKEKTYIERNIEATRQALNLTGPHVQTKQFEASPDLDSAVLAENAATVKNIRLWDPELMVRTYQRLQAFQPFYAINDVDVDRYTIDGETRQVMISARNLETGETPQSSWEARHLTYTHGYGAVAAPSNAKDANGRPSFLLNDVPPESDQPALKIDQPGIYIGENQGGYKIVNSDRREIDFQGEKDTQLTQYKGKDGVGIGNYLRRAAFALRFADFNMLISGNITSESKILMQRDIRERVEQLAPFLEFDADPYVVVVDGRLQWIIDAYTTTSKFPGAQRANTSSLPEGSGLNGDFNYVRNSVKAVVDAYDGVTKFYVVDEKDPLLKAYRSAFPKLFTDGSEVPDELRAHFRYPEDLFRVQTNMWGRYHIDDPDDFYNQNDAWNVAQSPDANLDPSTVSTSATGQAVTARQARMDPYYLQMRLPGEDKESFLLLRPFVPVSSNDQRGQLTAFMVAKSDPDSYGQLETFVMPRGSLPDGPALIAASMTQDTDVSELQTLLGQEGSDLLYGNLVMVPIENSLLYVRPVYTVADSNPVPLLKMVIVEFNGRVEVKETLEEALTEMFGQAPEIGEVDPGTGEGEETPPPSTDDTVAELLEKAKEAFADADDAFAKKDFVTWARKEEEGRDYLDQALEQATSSPSSSTTTTTAPPTTTTTAGTA